MSFKVTITTNEGEKIKYDKNELTLLLNRENSNTKEKKFKSKEIIKRMEEHLEMFLDDNRTIEKEKFINLIIKTIQKEGFSETAKNFAENQNNKQTFYKKNEVNMFAIYEKSEEEIEKCLNRKSFESLKNNRVFPGINFFEKIIKHDEEIIRLPDDLDGILENLKKLAINTRYGIRTGMNFSYIRPKNAIIKKSKGLASGPVAFIKLFIFFLKTLKTDLENKKKPVHEIILHINHPDIIEYLLFIKNEGKDLKNEFEFFVECDMAFISAKEKDENYDLIYPGTKKTTNQQRAKNTFELILSIIKENNNLGLLLPENNKDYSTDKKIATIHFNLEKFIENKKLNEHLFKNELKNCEKMFENVFMRNSKKPVFRVSFGGFMEMLIKMETSYNSAKCMIICEKITQLVKENLSEQIKPSILKQNIFEKNLGINGGIEALFSIVSVKYNMEGEKKYLFHNLLKTYEKILSQEETLNEIIKSNSLKNIEKKEIKHLKKLLLTTNDINPEWSFNLRQMFESKGFETEKKHYLSNEFKLESIFEKKIGKISQIKYPQPEKEQDNSAYLRKNGYIFSGWDDKKRNKSQIQPPLFQIKKTEEIFLPPITKQ